MENKNTADVAVVGAGIVGLAHAYMALLKGFRVVLFERDEFAVGASVRNFGLVWPIGQEPGRGLDRALRSRAHWMQLSREAGFWLNTNGSLHLAYHEDEWSVLEEFQALYNNVAGYSTQLISAKEVQQKSGVAKIENLKGALWSDTECTVYSREAIRRIPLYLQEKYGLILRFGHAVTEVSFPKIASAREQWHVDKVFVCSGADFETLYPSIFDQHAITKCKLQMLKAVSKGNPASLGPSLCAGLTLRHYAAFSKCPSLPKLDARYDADDMAFKQHGVHVLLAQNGAGDFIIGDSHHYQRTVEPFDYEFINDIILKYLETFANLGDYEIAERWHGVYPRYQGGINLVVEPEPGVTIINGLGGAGMTLSFGLAEEIVAKL